MSLVTFGGTTASNADVVPAGDGAAGLEVTDRAAERLTAKFGHSTHHIVVEAASAGAPVRATPDGSARATAGGARATASITLDGVTLTAERDAATGEASWNGAGTTIDPTEREALTALLLETQEQLIDPLVASERRVPEHLDILMRFVTLVSEAPVGVELGSYDAGAGEVRTEKKAKGATAAVVRTSATTSHDATAHAAQGGDRCTLAEYRAAALRAETAVAADGEAQIQLAACQQSDEDGIYYMACTTAYRSLQHDSDAHCFRTESIHTGPGSSECMGECGPGCNGINAYTYDCGDHDRCGRMHGGSLNPWDAECGDEYWEADDDFLNAQINRCSG
ncbi:hypothetical protein GCM10009751_04250 [Myceligenerans crystallogenes]|uniref:DUF8213 domain-containing protein n=2 Tax=Myceligenerans crystallogenes TaxID=316335 RepID=A0ABP4ZCC3_9MICO